MTASSFFWNRPRSSWISTTLVQEGDGSSNWQPNPHFHWGILELQGTTELSELTRYLFKLRMITTSAETLCSCWLPNDATRNTLLVSSADCSLLVNKGDVSVYCCKNSVSTCSVAVRSLCGDSLVLVDCKCDILQHCSPLCLHVISPTRELARWILHWLLLCILLVIEWCGEAGSHVCPRPPQSSYVCVKCWCLPCGRWGVVSRQKNNKQTKKTKQKYGGSTEEKDLFESAIFFFPIHQTTDVWNFV